MKVLVSACIVGRNCKYNGGNNYNLKVVEFLRDKEVIEICPEMLAGMEIPRVSAEIVNGRVTDQDGNDVHEEFLRAVNLAMDRIDGEDIGLAILQSRSPTCGVNRIYDGRFSGRLIRGQGVFARALIEKGYEVVDSEDFR